MLQKMDEPKLVQTMVEEGNFTRRNSLYENLGENHFDVLQRGM